MPVSSSNNFKNLHIVKHPLIQHKIAFLRDKTTKPQIFRALIEEITLLLAYAATENLSTSPQRILTPLESTSVETITTPIGILSILRAGMGMVDALLTLMPYANVGHIGIYRDEATLQPHVYYFKIPPANPAQYYFVCDPMLATGGTITTAINHLKQQGISKIIFISIIAAPEGVQHMLQEHPDVPVYTASLDRELNSHGYIVPGLGDAGDRIYGTK